MGDYSYGFLGLGAGFHKNYDVVCVMDFASEYEDYLENQGNGRKNPVNNTSGYRDREHSQDPKVFF